MNVLLSRFSKVELKNTVSIVGGETHPATAADGSPVYVDYDTGEVFNIIGKKLKWCDVWPCE